MTQPVEGQPHNIVPPGVVERIEDKAVEAPEKEEESPEQTPEPEQTPKEEVEAPPIEEDVPAKFKGKSAKEIAKAYEELENHLGELRNEVGMLRNMVPQQGQQSQHQAPVGQQAPFAQPVEQPEYNEDDYPTVGTTKQMLQKEMANLRQQLRYETAFKQGETAKMQAKAQYPQLFNGVNDNELNQLMYGGVQGGVLAPEALIDPMGWAMTAWQVKGRSSGFNVNAPPLTPTSPTGTETPTQVKQQGAPERNIKSPDGWDELWDKMGVPKDQRKSILEEQAKRRK